MGIDNISPELLKSCAVSLSLPITFLFQKCLTNSCILQEWKVHLFSPVPKSGDPVNVANYRPIALLCTISMMLEKLIFDHLLDYVYPFISLRQFGFVLSRSCLQQLLITFLYNFNNTRLNISTDLIYLDFSKAFDSVPHGELLTKLWNRCHQHHLASSQRLLIQPSTTNFY